MEDRKNRAWARRWSRLAVKGLSVLALSACASSSSEPDEADVGKLRAAVVASDPHDVASMHVKVTEAGDSCEGEAIVERAVRILDFGLPSSHLPAGGGDRHAFGDAFFTLPSGDYRVCLSPRRRDGTPSTECAPAETEAAVIAEATTEVVLVSQCAGDGVGGLDVVAALNDPPEIDGLTLDPSKFISVCDTATLTVSASDPDGDSLDYAWELVGLTAATLTSHAGGETARFHASEPGDYAVRVTVTDVHGATVSLSFPIYVVDAPACQDAGTGGQALPPSTFAVNPSIARRAGSAIPALQEHAPLRPVGRVECGGSGADLVENELIVLAERRADVEAVAQRHGGRIVTEIDVSSGTLAGLPTPYLIEADLSRANTSNLADDLRYGNQLRGFEVGRCDFRVSSQAVLGVLATVATETANGFAIGANWVFRSDAIRLGSTREAASGPDSDYQPNAFLWPYMRRFGEGDAHTIGVADAWRFLDLAGALNNRIGLGVIDGGFATSAEIAPDLIAQSAVAFAPALNSANPSSCGGASCPWHGMDVLQSAAGVADNDSGGAGPGGPVAQPITVHAFGDTFTTMGSLQVAGTSGARIVNMSFRTVVPGAIAFTAWPFQAAVAVAWSSGALLFASAGNDNGTNLDRRSCFGDLCWDAEFHVPCEFNDVVCVGALNFDNVRRAAYSNVGPDVRVWAPGTLYVGPNPASSGSDARYFNGTSAASPFAAGVAALVWAANPGLSNVQVRDRVLSGPIRLGRRNLDAYAAVTSAFPGSPIPVVDIFSPTEGRVAVNQRIELRARADHALDGPACCTVAWSSSNPADVITGNLVTFGTTGTRTLTAVATERSAPFASSAPDTVTVTVYNDLPVARIEAPASGTRIPAGSTIQLRGIGTDPNQASSTLLCRWTITNPASGTTELLGTGCQVPYTFSRLAPLGARVIRLTVTDSQGATDTAAVELVIGPPPANLPPRVAITSVRGTPYDCMDCDAALCFENMFSEVDFAGSVQDPEGATMSVTWTIEWPAGREQIRVETAAASLNPLPTGYLNWIGRDHALVCSAGCIPIRVTLRATDAGGASQEDVRDFTLVCPLF